MQSLLTKSLTRTLLPAAAVMLAVTLPVMAHGNKKPGPLVLEKQGSFFVNGEKITTGYTGSSAATGHIIVNQMYVEYWVPENKKKDSYPVVMLHGSNHTGKTYGETPDGREGWLKDFLRQGYTVYVAEQVGRARSSFNPSKINEARATGDGTIIPGSLSSSSYAGAWNVFRFGPQEDEWFQGVKFPIADVDQYMAQLVPNTESQLDFNYETGNALAALLDKIGPAVVMGHSQGGRYVIHAATQRPDLMKALILVEAACVLRDVPDPVDIGTALGPATLLNVYGDFIDQSSFWPGLDAGCETIANRVNELGGDAKHLRLPDIGIRGNDHMMMMDTNSKQIANVMMDWIEKHASKKAKKKKWGHAGLPWNPWNPWHPGHHGHH
jgi:pimeloyl-ACP methyl ester carboxylesterase